MYFSIADMNYHYEVHGEGTQVVFLHGFTGSTRTWDQLLAGRPSGFQWITVDLPGHGKTTGDTLRTMEECVADLDLLFEELELDRFFLVGYSMGGRTALSYAIKYPQRLQGLLLESASPGLFEEADRKARVVNDEHLARKIETEGVEAFVDYWENIPLFDTQKRLPENTKAALRSERLSQTRQGLANSLRGMGTGSQPSNWGKLQGLTVPVCLIVGELDEKFVRINEKMRNLLPAAKLRIIEESGHAVHIEKPTRFAEYLLEFANSHPS